MTNGCEGVRMYVIRVKGDDPKKSTALKLVRLGLARRIGIFERLPRHSVLLNPFAKRLLSPSDNVNVRRGGIAVLDTSWNLGLAALKRVFREVRGGVHRALPALFAANPINYGIAMKLSSAEAIASALYITGLKECALEVLSKFKWGETFLTLNKSLLNAYASALSYEDVVSIHEGILEKVNEA